MLVRFLFCFVHFSPCIFEKKIHPLGYSFGVARYSFSEHPVLSAKYIPKVLRTLLSTKTCKLLIRILRTKSDARTTTYSVKHQINSEAHEDFRTKVRERKKRTDPDKRRSKTHILCIFALKLKILRLFQTT